MRHSIRHQMAGLFIGIITGTLLLCWLVNYFFLEGYYVENKKKTIISAYEVLNRGVKEELLNDNSFTTKLGLICATDNISIFVMDNSGDPKLYTNRDYKALQWKLYNFIFEIEIKEEAKVLFRGENYVLRESRDHLTQAEYIEIIGTLDSGDPFIMRTAVESIWGKV